MTQVVLDPETRDSLRSALDPVDLVDENGQLLGMFCPVLQPPYNAALIPPISPAERAARMAEPGQFTTEDVLRHLKGL